MEQVKYTFHKIKSFILHHKTVSLFIAGIIILDISLLGVISDIQQRDSSLSSLKKADTSLSITPTESK